MIVNTVSEFIINSRIIRAKYQNITAWIVFAISLGIYLFTLDTSVSLWDCGEFIASGYKLENTHPPGAPLYMMLARVFSLFAPNVQSVAWAVNALSAVASAFTVFFLFKINVLLFAKVLKKEISASGNVSITVISAAGALVFAFSDSFWFSAVEAEVYALSVFFTTVTFWLMLLWDSRADEPRADSTLLLVALLMGLSVGVHLLNLLTIPAFVMIYGLRRYNPRKFGVILWFLAGIAVLFFVMLVLLKGTVKLAGFFELTFVNHFHSAYNVGLWAFFVVLIGFFIVGFIFSFKKKKYRFHQILWMTALFLLGFSTYIVVFLRAQANPPFNESNPDTIFALENYLNRDQYGSKPLLYGPNYKAEYLYGTDGKVVKKYQYQYVKDSVGYSKIKKKIPIYSYRNGRSVFPRMTSHNASDIEAYRMWGGIASDTIAPNFGNNMQFFATYQLGQMYFRYLMWNFAGRQNDKLGQGHFAKGNFVSGFNFADKYMISDESKGKKNDATRNVYYLLPLIFGIIGMVYTYKHTKRVFAVLMTLFVFTGLAIVVYLNQEPYQARERDYAYVGSFMVFAIWIAFGLWSVWQVLARYFSKRKIKGNFWVSLAFSLPLWMLLQNFDDHNRSGQTIVRDVAYNYLASCAPNAILFTNADNDTFPLWYLQEVEGLRTDVRVINLSLLNSDLYIETLRYKTNESESVKFLLSQEKYREGRRELSQIYKNKAKIMAFGLEQIDGDAILLADALRFLANEGDSAKIISGDERVDYIPTDKLALPVRSESVFFSSDFSESERKLFEDTLLWKYSASFIRKSNLAVLDIVASNFDSRPIYFSRTVEPNEMSGLKPYCRKEGLVYRIVPFQNPTGTFSLNSELQYQLLTQKFLKINTQANDFIRYDINRFLTMVELKTVYIETAEALISKGEPEKARIILNDLLTAFPYDKFSENDDYVKVALLLEEVNQEVMSKELKRKIKADYMTELEYIRAQEPPFSQFLKKREQKLELILKSDTLDVK